jgi:hypothetical protein
MSDTDGLLADAKIESDDNQQQAEEPISHLKPDGETIASNAVASEESTEPERPEWLPEKFNTGEDLAKAYSELQKKFSQGKHKAPETYDEAVFKDAGIPEDDALYQAYVQWATNNGVSQSAFDDLASTFIEMAGAEADLGEISYQEEYQKLGKNADLIMKSMTDWASSLVHKGVWSEDDFEEFKIMGGTAQGLRALQKIRSYYGDKAIPIDVGPVAGAPSKDELMAMVADPEYQTNPAFRAKVEKAFEKAFGTDEYSTI